MGTNNTPLGRENGFITTIQSSCKIKVEAKFMSNDLIVTKNKGRPTKYSSRTCSRVIAYTNDCQNRDKLPTIEGLAVFLGVGSRTIYDWESLHNDFSQTVERLRDTQISMLIENGLTGKYSSSFASFLLKSIHGFADSKSISATQNNYLNISPDVMADALKLMNKQD